MASLPGPLSRGICYAYKNGNCTRGDKCNYIHERPGMDADRPQSYDELVSIRRSKLNFVTRTVMSASADGKGYDQETAVAPKPGEEEESIDRLWLVVRSLKNPEGKFDYKIKKFDAIKLGRVRFRVKDFRCEQMNLTPRELYNQELKEAQSVKTAADMK